jgi:RimJ/RimL family protein N-acetyltransferase
MAMTDDSRLESRKFIKRISKDCPLKTERFFLRDLTEADASNAWLDWLSTSVAKQFILATTKTANFSSLKVYISERMNLDNVRFFGIFDSLNGKHIGNIKYEPIDITNSYAIMGVLIGDSRYKGEGVFPEIYKCSSRYIYDTYSIDSIFLGVDSSNISAIKSFEKVGFIRTMRHPLGDNYSETVMLDTSNKLRHSPKNSGRKSI